MNKGTAVLMRRHGALHTGSHLVSTIDVQHHAGRELAPGQENLNPRVVSVGNPCGGTLVEGRDVSS